MTSKVIPMLQYKHSHIQIGFILFSFLSFNFINAIIVLLYLSIPAMVSALGTASYIILFKSM